MRRLAAVLLCASFALACGKSTLHTGLGDGGALPPTVEAVEPASGPAAGGTTVSVWGDHFVSGAEVVLGGAPLTQVVFIGPKRITGKTTASTEFGPVDVQVTNPDGESGRLKGGFEVFPPPSQRKKVDACALVTPQALSMGSDSTSQEIVATVTAVGVTDQTGQGAGITGEVGYGPMDAEADTWTWLPASYDDSQSGPTFDGYAGTVTQPALGTHLYGFRFRYDGGSWTYCDLDGSDDGFSDAHAGVMTVHGPAVDWCSLQWPPEAISQPGQPITLTDGGSTSALGDGYVFGQVYKAGVTEAAGPPPGILAQFGYGPADGGPASPGWVWVDADYNTNCGACGPGQHNDEFFTQFLGPTTSGDYHFAYRFRVDVDGGAWTYCGLGNPLADPTQTGTLGVLHASGAPANVDRVSWCEIKSPAAMTAVTGQATPSVYSHVYLSGVTDQDGRGTGITSELGWGPTGTGPLDGSWSWTSAAYNPSCTTCGSDNDSPGNNNDEYFTSFSAPAPGSYAYAYRYQYQSGPYVYCGVSGVSDGGTEDLGALTVTQLSSSCGITAVDRGTVSSGGPVAITGSVQDAGGGVLAQVGVGAWGQLPAADWGWLAAGVQGSGPNGSTRYTVTVRPAYTGNRQVGLRISADDGGTWTYCDPSTAPDGGYLRVDAFTTGAGIGSCNLQYPPTLSDAGTQVYGHVQVEGLDAGAVTAELGYGQPSEDPGVSSGWTWLPAAFNPSCATCSGGTLEYQRAFPPLDGGTYHYAYRSFAAGTSAPYCYGDLDGSGNGFSGGQMGTATLP